MYVIILSRTSIRVNLHSIVCLNVKELLARSRHHIWSLNDSNGIRTHNLNTQTLRTKWLWVLIPLLSRNFKFLGYLAEHLSRLYYLARWRKSDYILEWLNQQLSSFFLLDFWFFPFRHIFKSLLESWLKSQGLVNFNGY